jgi:hypothetical protein
VCIHKTEGTNTQCEISHCSTSFFICGLTSLKKSFALLNNTCLKDFIQMVSLIEIAGSIKSYTVLGKSVVDAWPFVKADQSIYH